MKFNLFKKKNIKVTNELSTTASKININKLHEALGGKDNIAGLEYTHTKVKIFIYNRENVKLESIGAIKGISGVFGSKKYVTIVVGPSAKDLSKKL